METADGRYVLTFNGEILNYRELRRHSDYPYTSSGDTEVVLALLSRYGHQATNRLVGQFAFSLHDRESGRTWLVRDRLGVLPLYYYSDANQLVFASEIKALLEVVGDRIGLDRGQIRSYLKSRSVHAPNTLFRGVRKVPPGHVAEVSPTGDITVAPYWRLPNPDAVVECSPEQAVDMVDAGLRQAIDASLVADVPVGAYLSGGVDSSLIVALADTARRRSGVRSPLNTFSAEFGDARVDETSYAEVVSSRFKTDHHRVRIEPQDFQGMWEHLTWHRDAPVSEPADIAVAQLARVAREHVKVVLSGEGADELFGGYPKYRYAGATALLNRLPSVARISSLRTLERALPARREKLRVAVRALGGAPRARMEDWFAPFTDYEVDELLGERIERLPRELAHRDAVDLMGRIDLDTWLPDNLLERGDRMSMSASLELRPPFLDHRLVELAFRLPSSVKVRDGQTKWVLKEVARRYLPEEIVARPKVGFRVPLDAWFRGELLDSAHDLLKGPNSFVKSLMDGGAIDRILDDHARGRRHEEMRIWTLMSLEVWASKFFGASANRASTSDSCLRDA